ncbi:hypothetical protein ACI3EY_08045 [Ornithinimicrobium sp. LYQ92]|uniref:hypothetical protein n=1 Tax=Serinicoccus sp. LYQ92 TaxID=3378798 RepID=UPI00385425E1
MGLEAYERDLCPGCGWPRTYTMHAQAKHHWQATKAIRCHGCTPKLAAEDAHAKDKASRPGAYFGAQPDDGMVHAMANPVLTYEDDDARWITGASGLTYPPRAALTDPPDD